MKIGKLIFKNLLRHKGRTALSIGGVASAMALLVLVESLALGLSDVMSGTESARTLIVYRKNRYCPQTSFLPEYYGPQIEEIDGVDSVLPIKVYLNNCRASLDLVTFQGSPVDTLLETRQIQIIEGDDHAFRTEGDAALVGADFAARKGLKVGQDFTFGDIKVKVTGIFESTERAEQSLILTPLEFLQRASGVNRLGTVTQFEVKVADASVARGVANEIDARFATAEEPTDTRPRIAYLETATRDLKEILRFGRLLSAFGTFLIGLRFLNFFQRLGQTLRRVFLFAICVGQRVFDGLTRFADVLQLFVCDFGKLFCSFTRFFAQRFGGIFQLLGGFHCSFSGFRCWFFGIFARILFG